MSVYAYKGKVFTPIELAWIPILGVPTALGAMAALSKQNTLVPFVGWAILAAGLAGMWLIAGLYFLRKARWQKNLRMILQPPGIVVGWADKRYSVDGEEVNALVAECVLKMRKEFRQAEDALRGCVVWFREPTWIQPPSGLGVVALRVAGVQDGQLLVVGWNKDLTKTALVHELAHRVLQIYGGNPPDFVAHQMMERLGVL